MRGGRDVAKSDSNSRGVRRRDGRLGSTAVDSAVASAAVASASADPSACASISSISTTSKRRPVARSTVTTTRSACPARTYTGRSR